MRNANLLKLDLSFVQTFKQRFQSLKRKQLYFSDVLRSLKFKGMLWKIFGEEVIR